MAAFSDYSADAFLEWLVGKNAMPTLPTCYVALFTAMPADDGTGGTEVTGGSYARKVTSASDWAASSSTQPRTIANAALLSFPTATADWGTVIGFGLYDASSAGNLLGADYLGAHDWFPFVCSSASPGVLTAPGHGLSNSQSAVVTAEFGGTLPTTGGSWTGVKTVAGVSGDTFNLGVNTTGTGNGMARRVTSQVVSSGVRVDIAIGAAVIKLG